MSSSPANTALVLSGGGAYGAFAVGIMKVLCAGQSPATNYQPLNPEIFSGTSVGAFNAAVMVSLPVKSSLEAALRLKDIWFDHIAEKPGQCGNGVFRLRADPAEYINPSCLRLPARLAMNFASDSVRGTTYVLTRSANFLASSTPIKDRAIGLVNISSLVDSTPYQEMLNKVIREEDIFQSPKRLMVIATNWLTGKPAYFDNSSFQGDLGTKAIMASTAIPGVFPPVSIGNDVFVDGGVVENTPLNPAINLGATELHVISLNPDHANVQLKAELSTADTLLRFYGEMLATILNQDIETARWINAGLRAVADYQKSGVASSSGVQDFLKVANQLLQERSTPYRPLTVHLYSPEGNLGGAAGMLDFRLGPIVQMIREGERVASLHDCGESGCVL